MLEKILEILAKSERLGFSFLFGGAVIIAARYYFPEQLSFIKDDPLTYIVYATVVGGGLVLVGLFRFLSKVFGATWRWIRKRNRYVTAASRTDELLPEEVEALLWMLVNPDMRARGDLFDSPFQGLVRKGFAVPTDGEARYQVFKLHPYVRSKRVTILDIYGEEYSMQQYRAQQAPWIRRI